MSRWAWAEVSAEAIQHNVRTLVDAVTPSELWAVVKANGYGHGSVLAARAALDGGASGLCVALVQEGMQLRRAGITAPILVLSEQPPELLAAAVHHDLQVTVYSLEQVIRLERLGAVGHPVHLKVDTGMHRVGATPREAILLADAIGNTPAVRLEGVFTHLAVADEPADPYTARQLDVFDETVATMRRVGHRPRVVHAANSAAAISNVRARYDMVRTGISIYGLSAGHFVEHAQRTMRLRPAMSLHARVSHVQRLAAGERISYGLRHEFATATTVATLPIGYADGVPRRLHACGGAVLIGARRRPIVGVVTMDQLMVDCGNDDVRAGDDAVLIGAQGPHRITVTDWADRLGTIDYEVTCGISSRVERRRS
jgi:alanine racemase